MKKQMIRLLGIILLTAITVTLSAYGACANILISEVFYNATGVDTGLEWIEIYNNSSSNFDLSGYELNASSGDYYSFSKILAAGKCFVVHWNSDGVNTQTDLYTGLDGFSNMGNTSGWVALFNASQHSSSTIIDYLEYGAGAQTWESAAVGAGIWTEDDYIANAPENHSLEYLGPGNASSAWQVQSVPNPGSCIPEPTTLLLMASGLCSFFLKRRLI